MEIRSSPNILTGILWRSTARHTRFCLCISQPPGLRAGGMDLKSGMVTTPLRSGFFDHGWHGHFLPLPQTIEAKSRVAKHQRRLPIKSGVQIANHQSAVGEHPCNKAAVVTPCVKKCASNSQKRTDKFQHRYPMSRNPYHHRSIPFCLFQLKQQTDRLLRFAGSLSVSRHQRPVGGRHRRAIFFPHIGHRLGILIGVAPS